LRFYSILLAVRLHPEAHRRLVTAASSARLRPAEYARRVLDAAVEDQLRDAPNSPERQHAAGPPTRAA
jgi:hypothetical protein